MFLLINSKCNVCSEETAMEFEEILDTLVSELSERALKECRHENIEMDRKIHELVVLSEKVQKHLCKFDDEAKINFENYINMINLIAEMQQKHLYIQGAKDCAAFFKSLNII